jgi:hypothetical protein
MQDRRTVNSARVRSEDTTDIDELIELYTAEEVWQERAGGGAIKGVAVTTDGTRGGAE